MNWFKYLCNNYSIAVIFIVCLFIASCTEENSELESVPLPASQNSVFPFLTHDDSLLYLSWIETVFDSVDILKVARGDGNGFRDVTEVARGSDWFVNWADFPKVEVFPSGQFITHWLEKSSSSTYDYDVHVGIGKFGKSNFDTTYILHDDGVNAEHGFVSYLPVGDEIMAVWLDGRNTKKEDGSYGQMTLRSAMINESGHKRLDQLIDDRTCDCCQTDLAKVDDQVMVVYRDRSEEEIRDNYFAFFKDNEWGAPVILRKDNWQIAGCPVNGPAIHGGHDEFVAVGYTETEGVPGIYLSWFDKDERQFSSPVFEREGTHILGRLDVKLLDNDHAVLTWMEKEGDAGKLMLAVLSKEGKLLKEIMVDEIDSSRASGFAHLAVFKGYIYVVYTSSGSYNGLKMKKLLLI